MSKVIVVLQLRNTGVLASHVVVLDSCILMHVSIYTVWMSHKSLSCCSDWFVNGSSCIIFHNAVSLRLVFLPTLCNRDNSLLSMLHHTN